MEHIKFKFILSELSLNVSVPVPLCLSFPFAYVRNFVFFRIDLGIGNEWT
jgi:hypothetical protein